MISKKYQNKNSLSPRYQRSPYLSPVLGIVPPRYQVAHKEQKYRYPTQHSFHEYPPLTQPKSAREKQVAPVLTYSQRMKSFEKREKEYDKKLSQKYVIANPMDPYKHSMYGAYKKSIIIAKRETNQKEQHDFEMTTQNKKKRLQQNYNEAVLLHRQQAKEEINDCYF